MDDRIFHLANQVEKNGKGEELLQLLTQFGEDAPPALYWVTGDGARAPLANRVWFASGEYIGYIAAREGLAAARTAITHMGPGSARNQRWVETSLAVRQKTAREIEDRLIRRLIHLLR